MLIEEPQILTLLRQIVAGFTTDPVLQADLMQESLVHLWKVQREKPGRTRSWYLQSCRFHLQHWLELGRSLDSPKRASGNKRIVIDGDGEDPALSEYHTNGELFETVCFQDLVSTLSFHLKPRERVVLGGLSEGLRLGEITSESGLSFPTVLKYRRNIASLTRKLGISRAVPGGKPNGYVFGRARRTASGNKLGRSGIKGGPGARLGGKRSAVSRGSRASNLG
jgi:DNA-binding CsgD family transcriptional regulator